MITLNDGTEVSEQEFYSWSAKKQNGALLGRSEETKAKIRATKAANPFSPSDLTRLRMSANKLGQKQSKEVVAARVAGRSKNGPFRHTDETRAQIAETRRSSGIRPTLEARAKTSAALKGKPWTDARRAAHEARKAAGASGT